MATSAPVAAVDANKTPHVIIQSITASNVGFRPTTKDPPIAADVLCHVRYGGQTSIKSSIQLHTTTPTWNNTDQPFIFTTPNKEDCISIQLYASSGIGKDELLGETSFSLSPLFSTPDTPTSITLPLLRKSSQGDFDAGEVVLQVIYEPISSSSPPPNTLIVTLLEAEGLLAKDGHGEDATSDPFVQLNCMGKKYKTHVIPKTLSPQWRQRFYFPWNSSSSSPTLELLVQDKDLVSTDFLGRAVINLLQWYQKYGEEKQIVWLGLEPASTTPSSSTSTTSNLGGERTMEYGHGQICISISFVYLKQKIETLEQGEVDHETIIPTSIPSTSKGEGGERVEEVENPKDSEQRKAQEQALLNELSTIHWSSGEYQVRIYIYQVQELQPMDLNGLCDPVVQLECMGQKQYTKVYRKQLSCTMNESFSFYFPSMTAETIQQASVKLTVLDADGPTGLLSTRPGLVSQTIGFCSIDLPYVYVQLGHQLERKWVALVGTHPENSDTIQGYLLFSMVVFGPGDQVKLCSPSKEPVSIQTSSQSIDANALVLVPPRVTQTLHYLVLTLYEANDLPVMDHTLLQRGGIDAYIRVTFAATASGNPTLETKKVTCKGQSFLDAEFLQELWFPVMLPTMSTFILISLWDWDLTTDELVGQTNPYNMGHVLKYPRVFDQSQYANLYGPPVGFLSESTARADMFAHPTTASTYRGRIRLSLRVETREKSVHDRPHSRNLTISPDLVTPHLNHYRLRIALFYGTEIPMFKSKTAWHRNSKMSIQISIGKYMIISRRVPNEKGICHWNEYLELSDITFPGPLEQLPDLMIHLVRQQLNETRLICFTRVSVKDVWNSTPYKPPIVLPPPIWKSLQEDTVVNDLYDQDFTGNILLNLQFEPVDPKEDNMGLTHIWKTHSQRALPYTKYTLFVYIFQGRGLPAADTNGSLDPYVKVTCGGAEGLVKKRVQTRDPCWYETVTLDLELPTHDIEAVHFLPKVSIQVFDYDEWDTDDYVGKIQLGLAGLQTGSGRGSGSELGLSSTEYATLQAKQAYTVPRPQWYPLYYTTEGDSDGELLLSFELIRKETPDAVVNPPESIRPVMEDRVVEITCLGCRGLQPVGFMSLHAPLVQVDVGDGTIPTGRSTNPSSKPSPQNPNYLERMLIPMKLPVDALYAPRLNLRVYDQLLGGFYQPLIGMCSIELATRLPISNGQPNPLYVETRGFGVSGNPYLAQPPDFSTFPGRIPVETESQTPPTPPSIDSGAGLKAACFHNVWSSSHSPSIDQPPLSGYTETEEEEEDVPLYLQYREVVDGALDETLLHSPPFESFQLFRGELLVRSKGKLPTNGTAIPTVGRFKGMVRVLLSKTDPPVLNLNHFYTPQQYLIRIYLLDAMELISKPSKHSVDPYLRLQIGQKTLINDRKHYHSATNHPKFHTVYEYPVELPGDSLLRVEVVDYDAFALRGEELIGTTVIDLEDRWFSREWQALGSISTSISNSNSIGYKPIECRSLYTPSSTFAQGRIRLWVDILTPLQIPLNPPIHIALPPRKPFEIRVIIYKAKNVVAGDRITQLTDLSITTWLQNESEQAQHTDTHWRARNGQASFNWRMKFTIELPLEETDRGYLHLQLWDKDVLYDDCLADTVMDLSLFLQQAYKTDSIINVFAKKKEKRVRGGDRNEPLSGRWVTPTPPPSAASAMGTRTTGEEEEAPLLASTTSGQDRPALLSKQQEQKASAVSLVQSIKHKLGMGDDPEDASWLTCTTRDPITGDRVAAGQVLVSIEILPMAIATTRAAGLGRSEPNNFPVLAEPADRLHLSAMWNPLYVLEVLVGPQIYRVVSSTVACLAFGAFLLFAGPFLNVLATILELIPSPYGWIMCGVCLVVVMMSLSCCVYRCRRALGSSAESKTLENRDRAPHGG